MKEGALLAPFTTFRLGGRARVLKRVETSAALSQAVTFAHTHNLPVAVLGGGSNILVPDEGVDGLVLKIEIPGISFHDGELVAGAGVPWEEVVRAAIDTHQWGIENLAGIPGSVGGAVVQNIGAYGAELSEVFAWAEAFDVTNGTVVRFGKSECSFGYRESLFKKKKRFIVTRAAFRVRNQAKDPNLAYKDLADAAAQGVPLTTPEEIARAVRAIRSGKFPNLSKEGTAGSFFKNPVVSSSTSCALQERFPDMPQFRQPDGSVKISLAWILDHALHLKGYAVGNARVFRHQPLVLVARRGASAHDVETLAKEIEARVLEEIGIPISREVETFAAHPCA